LPVATTTTSPPPPPKLTYLPGSHAQLIGLVSAALLNGKMATIKSFDNTTQRFVVQLDDGSLKRVKKEHLAPPVQKLPQGTLVQAVDPQATAPTLSVCNAYPEKAPLTVFLISKDGTGYAQVVHGLAYQSCADVQEFHTHVGYLSFVIGRLQVAKIPMNLTKLVNANKGVEMVVFRSNVNSLAASIQQIPFRRADPKAYYLNLVNAYVGSRLLELHIARGRFVERLPMNRTYRLSREEQITVTLTDGFQRLEMAFQPRRSRHYCIMTTGVDEGMRGSAFNVGLVGHELGAWTSMEEMTNQDEAPAPAPSLQAAAPPTLDFDAESAGADDGSDGASGKGIASWLTSKISHFRSVVANL
jgi:hypothetical protein